MKWRGIQINEVSLQGEVVTDPVFNGDFAFMDLETVVTQRDANGQYVEIPQIIPLMVEAGSPNVRVVKEYVKAGRKLHVNGQYKSWNTQGQLHVVVSVSRIKLGDKPFESFTEKSMPLPPQ
jgi:hypothetical protein